MRLEDADALRLRSQPLDGLQPGHAQVRAEAAPPINLHTSRVPTHFHMQPGGVRPGAWRLLTGRQRRGAGVRSGRLTRTLPRRRRTGSAPICFGTTSKCRPPPSHTHTHTHNTHLPLIYDDATPLAATDGMVGGGPNPSRGCPGSKTSKRRPYSRRSRALPPPSHTCAHECALLYSTCTVLNLQNRGSAK